MPNTGQTPILSKRSDLGKNELKKKSNSTRMFRLLGTFVHKKGGEKSKPVITYHLIRPQADSSYTKQPVQERIQNRGRRRAGGGGI